jgi:hypothetical protein
VVEQLAAAGLPLADEGVEAGVDLRHVVEAVAVEGDGEAAVAAATSPGESTGQRGGECL